MQLKMLRLEIIRKRKMIGRVNFNVAGREIFFLEIKFRVVQSAEAKWTSMFVRLKNFFRQ